MSAYLPKALDSKFYLNTPKNAMIKKKNPREYIDKLYFHKNINKFSEYLR